MASSHQLPGDKAEISESGAMSGQRISKMEVWCDDACEEAAVWKRSLEASGRSWCFR